MDDDLSKPLDVRKMAHQIEAALSAGRSVAVAAPPEPGPVQPPASAPFDVEELLGRCLGDPEFVELILIAFRDRAGAMMQQLEDALAANDANLAARAAHGIKGAAANLSASTLRDLAAELEDVGHRGCLDAARRCHDRLKNSVKACIDYIPRAVTETAAAAKRSE